MYNTAAEQKGAHSVQQTHRQRHLVGLLELLGAWSNVAAEARYVIIIILILYNTYTITVYIRYTVYYLLWLLVQRGSRGQVSVHPTIRPQTHSKILPHNKYAHKCSLSYTLVNTLKISLSGLCC
jgi:hypothetical protein